MAVFLSEVHSFLWGALLLLLILFVGIYYSLQTGFAQLTLLPSALRSFFRKLLSRKQSGEGVSSFQALCTALAATVGTGNIVGVAGAISLGGPGAVFWMWVCGILGMIVKFAEVTLAVHYRVHRDGEYLGGPMYIISSGMGDRWRWLAVCYALFGMIAAFGVGNATQINAVISGLNGILADMGFGQSIRRNLGLGLLLAVLVGAMLLGGAGRIGSVAEKLVPFVSVGYMILCIGALLFRFRAIPGAVQAILQGAFSPRSVTGGIIGSAMLSVRYGCSRGVFTNEAGMGTASIAHASARTAHPVEQGLMGIVEVFLDTILICTLTAMVILTSGIPIPYGTDAGGTLTTAAFCSQYGQWVKVFLTAALCCFAFATVLGWGLYGARCAQFLFGNQAWGPFALLQTLTVILGAVLDTRTVWLFSEITNGLMAIPNLIALAVLSPVCLRLIIEYKIKSGILDASGGTYADFHQCKPLRALSHAEIPPLRCGSGKEGKKDLSSEHRSA